MKGLRRSGSGSGVGAPPDAADSPPDAADSPPVSASPAGGAASGEQPGGRAVRRKRRRRRRRLLIAAPFVAVLLWAVFSYTTWMLRPTSLAWQINSVEWVRHDVPFGNWVADNVEQHLLHPERAQAGRPAAEEPADGRAERAAGQPPEAEGARTGRLAAADHAGLPAPAAGRRGLEAGRPAGGRRPAGAGDDLPPRARLSADRRLRRLVRPYAHPDRVLPGPLRAAERRRARADDGPLRSALAAAGDLQRRLHLHRRQQRLGRQRPHERAADRRQRHAHRLSRRPRRDREVDRRPGRGAGRRVGPPEPGSRSSGTGN